jgi:chemotaxis regulatin CheY-phosphate phosphatase CheZ
MAEHPLARESRKLTDEKTALLRSAVERRKARRDTPSPELVERLDYVVKMARQYEAAVIRVPDAVHGAGERLEQAKRELLEATHLEEVVRLQRALEIIASNNERQAECLEHYAEMAGFKAGPLPSVFHLQAMHFRDFATDARAALTLFEVRR